MNKSLVVLLALALAASAYSPLPTPVVPNEVQAAGVGCDVCIYFVGAIESWIASNYTEQQIIAYLNSLCSLVPAFEDMCEQMVKVGVKKVIQWVRESIPPQLICASLGFCENKVQKLAPISTIPYSRAVSLDVKDSTSCFICEQVIDAIEGWLSSEHTLIEMEEMLKTLCTWVPAFEKTCESLIKTGLPAVVNWIKANHNGTVVCTRLGVCGETMLGLPAPLPRVPKEILAPSEIVIRSEMNCEICKTVVGAIASWIASNHTIRTIEEFLEEQVCALVPAFKAVCVAIVETGVETVVKWLKENANAESVCFQLGMCSYRSPLLAAPFTGNVVIN